MSRHRLSRVLAGVGTLGLAAGLMMAAPGVAHAAVPDKWGFAFIDNPSVAGIPDPTHQAGSWPAPMKVHSAPGLVGQVIVRFPGLASRGGVVHVTAVIDIAVFCQAQSWRPSGTAEQVVVRCFKSSGTPFFAPFVVLYTKSSSSGALPPGRAYGYVHYQPVTGVVASFNSAGKANSVSHAGTGLWVVRMPGFGSTVQTGGVQVTAVDSAGPAKCTLSLWLSKPSEQIFDVRCYHPGVAPLNTGWTISYQRERSITGGGLPGKPRLYAYTANTKPVVVVPYAPPAPLNFNSAGGVNKIRRAGTGLSLVTFPHVGVLPNTVLVTGWHVGAGFCTLNSLWATIPPAVIVRDVTCYTAAGVPGVGRSFISYSTG